MIPHTGEPASWLENARGFLESLLTVTDIEGTAESDHVESLRLLPCYFACAFMPTDISQVRGTLDAIRSHRIIRFHRNNVQASRSQH
ncbi:hypothetical protein D3C84_928930 [compost metagenome]